MTTRSAASRTSRERAKAQRADSLLQAAARLFAEHGFDGVSLEDLGTAVGITGPAVYRHFDSKRALLGAILLRASDDLLTGGRRVIDAGHGPDRSLRDLVDFHVQFAVRGADVIRVHDRDLARLSEEDRHEVRRLQREYVELWVGVLHAVHPDLTEPELRVRAHAGFGLINSTPYAVRTRRDAAVDAGDDGMLRDVLADMAYAALAAR
ncbi:MULTISPECIES: TetR/AcrR family transcriptional regulator [Microbacterium]|uniref:TetR family transcriptional regulator n=1 Tax=Microbacterium hominis TaxID=162426 RepID=A0A2K9DAQ7_9MICO|nr:MULTISPECIES: TetR/AcrR family transcriptional regulator [Microbacterium]AUG29962.1 TetR family transcriptional regulator [Microbacterium hominis]QOC25668.1 TetR/AcrR family transcriptional regulator [Microbacterium hominis]QOC29665.1 TetR/AcrR family transcriptional regulator [Microbacterium hominis]QYF97958.1 TetR/AcrR family transcriptional regulator [Microbacterium sp. PAMC21962]